MDLSRAFYSRDLKIAAMRAIDAGSTTGEIARKYQLSPHLLHRWRGEWRAKGDLAFPGLGRRGAELPAVDDARRIAELERSLSARRSSVDRRNGCRVALDNGGHRVLGSCTPRCQR